MPVLVGCSSAFPDVAIAMTRTGCECTVSKCDSVASMTLLASAARNSAQFEAWRWRDVAPALSLVSRAECVPRWVAVRRVLLPVWRRIERQSTSRM